LRLILMAVKLNILGKRVPKNEVKAQKEI